MTATHPEYSTMALDTTWKLRAACKDAIEASIFFDPNLAREAKKFCNGCPVRPDCLEYALLTEQYGIWGGMSDRERNKEFPLYIRDSMREDYT